MGNRYIITDCSAAGLPPVYEIRGVGVAIWTMLERGASTADELVDGVMAQYEIDDRHQALDDVTAFLDELTHANLLQGWRQPRKTNEAPSSSLHPIDYDSFLDSVSYSYILGCQVELTYKCNIRCVHCYAEAPSRTHSRAEFTVEELAKLMDDLKDAGCLILGLTGGEPLTRPDLSDILQEAAKRHFSIRLLTNGTALNPKIVADLQQLPVRSVEVSVFASSPSEHDSVAGVPGAYEKTMRGIRLLTDAGVKTCLRHVVVGRNAQWSHELRAMAETLGATYLNTCGFLHPSVYGSRHFMNLLPPIEDIKQLVTSGIIPVPYGPEDCSPARLRCAVTPFGDVKPCELLPITFGNVKQEHIIRIWQSEAMNEFRKEARKKDPDCVGCTASQQCLRCPAGSYLATGSLTKPIPFVCNLAEIFREQAAAGGADRR